MLGQSTGIPETMAGFVSRQLREKMRGLGRFARRKPLGAVGLFLVVFVIFVAAASNILTPYDPDLMDRELLVQPPSAAHPFGTDNGGRDMMSRIIIGARISVYVGFMSVFIATIIAAPIGVTSAYFGGKYDLVVQRIVDVLMAFPGLILAC